MSKKGHFTWRGTWVEHIANGDTYTSRLLKGGAFEASPMDMYDLNMNEVLDISNKLKGMKVCLEHDTDKVIGKVADAWVEDGKGMVEIHIDNDLAGSFGHYTMVTGGRMKALSVMHSVSDGGLAVKEISLCQTPARPGARITHHSVRDDETLIACSGKKAGASYRRNGCTVETVVPMATPTPAPTPVAQTAAPPAAHPGFYGAPWGYPYMPVQPVHPPVVPNAAAPAQPQQQQAVPETQAAPAAAVEPDKESKSPPADTLGKRKADALTPETTEAKEVKKEVELSDDGVVEFVQKSNMPEAKKLAMMQRLVRMNEDQRLAKRLKADVEKMESVWEQEVQQKLQQIPQEERARVNAALSEVPMSSRLTLLPLITGRTVEIAASAGNGKMGSKDSSDANLRFETAKFYEAFKNGVSSKDETERNRLSSPGIVQSPHMSQQQYYPPPPGFAPVMAPYQQPVMRPQQPHAQQQMHPQMMQQGYAPPQQQMHPQMMQQGYAPPQQQMQPAGYPQYYQ